MSDFDDYLSKTTTMSNRQAIYHDEIRRHLHPPTNPIYPGSNQHAPNEHIRVEDFQRAAKASYHLFKSAATLQH